jgi:2-polyprenyl-3-methyl-5-hydroxy-6-metoxy-1,4-benzoquinol methylase
MNLSRRLSFALFYLRKPRWDTGITPPELEEFVQSHPAGRALELGCGSGTNAIYLARHGWTITAVDFVGKAIRMARQKARQAGIRVDFRRDDVTRLKGIQGPFDLVLDIGCFHSLAAGGKATYIGNLERLLAPGGIFLLYTFIAEEESTYGLSPDDLRRLEVELEFVKREDGTDQGRPSAWFTFQRPGKLHR